jgi:hypothetical protein
MMRYPAQAVASIVNERQNDWRLEVDEDRRFASAQPRAATGPRFRLPVVGGLSLASIRRRIPGAPAEA